jgi:hypothetical protein
MADMELETFIVAVGRLRARDVVAIATQIEAAAASAAGEVAWWQATVEIDRLLRQRRCSRQATVAAPSTASEVARALVAGDAELVGRLLATWQVLIAA